LEVISLANIKSAKKELKLQKLRH